MGFYWFFIYTEKIEKMVIIFLPVLYFGPNLVLVDNLIVLNNSPIIGLPALQTPFLCLHLLSLACSTFSTTPSSSDPHFALPFTCNFVLSCSFFWVVRVLRLSLLLSLLFSYSGGETGLVWWGWWWHAAPHILTVYQSWSPVHSILLWSISLPLCSLPWPHSHIAD